MSGEPPLLEATDVRVTFPGPPARTAVDGASVTLARGRTLGLVGESGSGKSTLARALLRLVPLAGGTVRFDGTDLASLDERALRRLRPRMQMVWQDPEGSLDPRQSVGAAVAEPLVAHGRCTRREARTRAEALLERCGLPAGSARRRPRAFSGGQRQRVAIARALALDPDLLVCDEPTSALDVTVQARILELLAELRRERGLAMVFITHDLALVARVADELAVMQDGRIVEQGPAGDIIGAAAHPYTRSLLAAVPAAHPAEADAREEPVAAAAGRPA